MSATRFLVGADEAGYGPNYGPLVVGATAWQLEARAADVDLYAALADAVVREPPRGRGDERLVIGDSKRLYSPAGGLAPLERVVLAACRASDAFAADVLVGRSWRDLWRALDPNSERELLESPWHRDYERRVPAAASVEAKSVEEARLDADVTRASERLHDACATAGVRLANIAARGVFPAEFNRETARRGNKAELLSLVTLGLVRDLLRRHAADAGDVVRITCDKHGGRNHYAALLQHVFPESPVEVRRESRDASVYRWREGARQVEIEFRLGGEAALPVALASMTAKYLRELAMEAFNAFWRREAPGLAPTAGYPTDAKRFRQEIAARQAALGISDGDLWRER